VDEGLVALDDVPRSAVRPIEATVVHGRPEPSPEEAPFALPLDINITTTLSDVRFEGLGLSADLTGTLEIEQPAAGPLLVSGTANIQSGTFAIYGQALAIDRGQLIFTGPPDNPNLNLRATREVDDATVGLLITGTARHPRSEIFSEPALPESEAFARLVTGRSLSSPGTADPEALERAAIGLGLKRALPTLDRIGENIGLDELGVADAGDAGGAIVAGKQLGEDVYLRYKHGLFDDFAGLELIYRITERFRLRTETGTSQSLDLIYEVDRSRRAKDDDDDELLSQAE
jgi:translocation and assembly module TamB